MGTKVPGYERSQERKFPGTFVLQERERKFRGTKVPGTFVPGERKFSIGIFRSWERKVLGTKSLVKWWRFVA